MSAKRKLKRSARSPKTDSAPTSDKRTLRQQTSGERFKKPGSDKLWEALLGWDDARLRRIWLVQGVHDASVSSPQDPKALAQALPARLRPEEGSLDVEKMAAAVSIWASDSHDFSPDDPAPKWHLLANLVNELGWGPTSPQALQLDWETWTNLALAGRPRVALMQLLQQTEAASLDLDKLTSGDNLKAVANVSRALWYALAYGDQETFDEIKSWSARFSPKLPGR